MKIMDLIYESYCFHQTLQLTLISISVKTLSSAYFRKKDLLIFIASAPWLTCIRINKNG